MLDSIDSADITQLDFVELNACNGGCVGGAMTVANPYIAQARLQELKRYLPVSPNRPASDWIPDKYFQEKQIEYNPYSALSSDRKTAIRMMQEIEELTHKLPGLDCGSCGAPTCMAFAEDLVKKETCAEECTVLLKKIIKEKGIPKDILYSQLGIREGSCSQNDVEENSDDGK